MPEKTLTQKVCDFLRESEDDPVLASLVLEAQQYLKNAGIKKPTEDEGEIAQYTMAVTARTYILYFGDEKGRMQRVLDSIVHQFDRSGGETA